ncbi:thermonuclease family protein [Streptomyces sp. NPDC091027]|uniref:thermonuclease family protein n=1 Tax=Streptomyces sp. NPDC091027 TaxID=3365971 RepID=UPI0037FCFF9B
MHEYRAKVMAVVDGDTLDVEIDLGFEVATHQRIRLFGINCPEKNTQAGRDARQFAIDWITANGPDFILRTVKDTRGTDKREKYGRYLGHLYNATGTAPLNFALVDAGLATFYDGTGPRI